MVFGFFDDVSNETEKKNRNVEYEKSFLTLDRNLKDDIDGVLTKYNVSQNNKLDIYNYSQQKPLIIHCCHHKTGTVVIEKILRAVSQHYGFKYQYCGQSKLEPDTDIWMQHHSKIDFSQIDRPIIGTHMIRNPCGIIVSAYEYHKHTREGWANRKINSLNKMTYKGILNSLCLEDGLIFEMKNDLYVESSKNTIMDMYNWDYMMPNFLEVKYEDLMTNYNGVLTNMFKHYGFSKEMINTVLELASQYNLRNKNKQQLAGNGHITNKNIDLDKWKEYFRNPVIIKRFWKLYPEDIFDKLGYPVDNLCTLEQSMLNGGRGHSLYLTDGEKLEMLKEDIWKRYGGENPYVCV